MGVIGVQIEHDAADDGDCSFDGRPIAFRRAGA
jgi:hypothetical protein